MKVSVDHRNTQLVIGDPKLGSGIVNADGSFSQFRVDDTASVLGAVVVGTVAITAGICAIGTALASAPVSAPIAAAGGMLLGGTASAAAASKLK